MLLLNLWGDLEWSKSEEWSKSVLGAARLVIASSWKGSSQLSTEAWCEKIFDRYVKVPLAVDQNFSDKKRVKFKKTWEPVLR